MAAAKKTAKKASKKATKKTARKAPAKKAAKKGAKKATKRTAKKASGATGSVVVTSKVRERLRSGDARMSGEFVEALNGEVDALVERAIQRAKDNGRSTVRPQDL